jgi:G3E family GTPase
MAEAAPRLVPVTVLSGFLGSGKTTLVKRIAEGGGTRGIALIVNDMAETNVDAELLQGEGHHEHLVPMQNGCVCCTLRPDFVQQVFELARLPEIDHILVESTGISEPRPVAEALMYDCATDESGSSVPMDSVVSVAAMVTVIDASQFLEQLGSLDTLSERKIGASLGDPRHICELLIDQVEFANIVLLNKSDLASKEDMDQVERAVRGLNPTATVEMTSFTAIDTDALMGSRVFAMEETVAGSGWRRALKPSFESAKSPETETYAISSRVFRARRPFHPQRLYDLFSSSLFQSGPSRIVRSKGVVWLAGAEDRANAVAGFLSHTGRYVELRPWKPWLASLPRSAWPPGASEPPGWTSETGDRRTQIALIGVSIDWDVVMKAVQACLVSDSEFHAGPEAWGEFPNPFWVL